MYNYRTPTRIVFISVAWWYTVVESRSEAGTGTEPSLRANVVSFYMVCWLGVLSVIGRNKLACDWPD